MTPEICSQHQWIDKIEAMIPDTARLNLRRAQDYLYVETVNEQRTWNDPDAYNFSNSTDHDNLVKRAVALLLQRAGNPFVKHLLGELSFRKTYGALREMAVYDWMGQAGIDFTPQVVLGPADVVNPNGSTLDGSLVVNGKTVYFDIKGFGFVDHKIAILKQKLEDRVANDEVLIEGSVSVSIDDVQTLLEKDGFEALLLELANRSSATRGSLGFRKRPRPKISIGATVLDPNKLAIENREYALRFGSQFTRQAPFLLLFVIHPWFSKGALHQNFARYTDIFCAEFARLTFLSFAQDGTTREGLPTNDLVKLLSAVAFINVWPQASSRGAGPSVRLYLNPNATHTIVPTDLAALVHRIKQRLQEGDRVWP
jgi:hypothetical protein